MLYSGNKLAISMENKWNDANLEYFSPIIFFGYNLKALNYMHFYFGYFIRIAMKIICFTNTTCECKKKKKRITLYVFLLI